MKLKKTLFVFLIVFLLASLPVVYAAEIKIDSCESQSTSSDGMTVWDAASSATGQCFNQSQTSPYKITVAAWLCNKIGNPVGNMTARLYAFTGTYGTDGHPDGDFLAESDKVALASMPGAVGWVNFTFTGAEQYSTQNNTKYCIVFVVVEATTLDGSNNVNHYYHTTTTTHAGNSFFWGGASWTTRTYDRTFIVYGQPAVTPLTFNGEIPIAFNVDHDKQVSMSREGSITETFSLSGLKAITWSQYGSIPFSFSMAHNHYGLPTFLYFYGDIGFRFGLQGPTVSFPETTIPVSPLIYVAICLAVIAIGVAVEHEKKT